MELLALILAVLYTGSTTAGPHALTQSWEILQLYDDILSEIDISVYHVRNVAASTQLLQGYAIMNTFKVSQRSPFAAFGFLPLAIRFAQSLRLYVEKKMENAIDVEVRRRIWWHLLYLDVEATISNGLPTIMRPTGYTTQLPSMVFDDAITELSSSPNPKHFSPMMIAIQGHYQWAHRMQTWFERIPEQEEVLSFKSLIESLIQLIPSNQANGEEEWARTYLMLQIDRAYCMFGLRFWRLEQFKGTSCDSEVVRYTIFLFSSTSIDVTHC